MPEVPAWKKKRDALVEGHRDEIKEEPCDDLLTEGGSEMWNEIWHCFLWALIGFGVGFALICLFILGIEELRKHWQ